MKRFIVITLVVALSSVWPHFFAFAAFISSFPYHFSQQHNVFSNLPAVNNDLNNSVALQYSPRLELNDENLQVVVGQQNNMLSNGFVADTSGICGIRTTFKTNGSSVDFLYGNNGQNIVAAVLSTAFQAQNNLNLEALYFETDTPFWGIKVSGTIAKDIMFSAETSENLVTQAKGYLFKTRFKDTRGNADLSVSYRYIEPTALSDYSATSIFDDSKGLRFETNYKLADNLTLTAYQDFAQAQDKSSKNANNITLTWVF